MICFLGGMPKFVGLALFLLNSLRISHAQDEELLDKVAFVPGNFTIAVLFSVHEASSNLYYPKCGRIQDQAGMQRVEAALWELKQINKKLESESKNYNFGLEIRDTCGSYVYAFQQGLSIYNNASSQPNKSGIVGTVGPAFSAEIRITNEWIGQHMPQIGFSATSPRMTAKKENFKNFARLVPSDIHQAQVIVDLIKHFELSCVNTIITAGVYGSDALKAFNETTKNSTIRIGNQEIVYDDANDTEVLQIFRDSISFSRVVICFCEGRTVRRLYNVTKNLNKAYFKKPLLFISSDGWTEIDDITQGFEQEHFGSIMINTSPKLKINDSFAEHYPNLSNWKDTENPWKEEFYIDRFNCSLMPNNSKYSRCNGNETLQKNFFQDPKLSLVRHSIRAVAEAMNHYIEKKCSNSTTVCDRDFIMRDFSNFTASFMNFIQHESKSVKLNEKGDPQISEYEMLFFGKHQNEKFTFHMIGTWSDVNGTKLKMQDTFNATLKKYRKIENRCNLDCTSGQFRKMKNLCWTCTDCNETSVSDGTRDECEQCDICKKPDSTGSKCVPKKNNLRFGEADGCLSIFISLLGAVLTSYTAYVFYKYRRTPIVRFSSTHLSNIIFCGMGLAYSCTLLNIFEPTLVTCIILRFIPSISLTMIYAPVLMKTNRISRALSAAKKRFPTLRMKYLSAAFLVSMSLMFVLIDVTVCSVQTIISTREDNLNMEPNCSHPEFKNQKVVFCPTESLGQFNVRHIVNIFLLIYCGGYAYTSGKDLPANFNETKFIIVSCCSTAVVWTIFLVAIIFLQKPEQWAWRILFLSLALSLSALINLVCLYFPKLYVILFRSKRNHRAFYSTVTGMRCYFGNTESRCRGFSSVNMDSTAGDPSMITEKSTLKFKGNKKIEKTEKKSKSSKCGANGLICTCRGVRSLSN